ncbi:T9SS type A sorting domain-containing protein [candidate division WOR-3 bacterium]|nr:T9SS type A sorting domain-containing protein [candidate division WOR-3 bacterium]
MRKSVISPKKALLLRVVLFSVVFLHNYIFEVNAATINAASCEQMDVQAAIDSASNGDTVVVPAGEGTWDSGVSIPDDKNIMLQGAGMDLTIITRSSTGTAVDLEKTSSRVTGFTFNEGRVSTSGSGWRVDHCKIISDEGMVGVMVRGTIQGVHPDGLVDHCTFQNARVVVMGAAAMLHEGPQQHYLWVQELDLGTDRAVYVEDCTFTYTVFGNCMDANYGGKYVFRYNTINDVYIEAHSVQGENRATIKWEIYNNTINQVDRSMWTPFFIRGGTGVVFNNTLTGTWTSPRITLDNVRTFTEASGGGFCNGGSPWDGNEPLEMGGTGIHTGTSGSTTLTDSSQDWEVNSLVENYVYNMPDSSKGQITANTANTVTAILSGGTDNDWDTEDQYKITNGYPCRDQIGRSTDEYLWTDGTPYPPQDHEPAYSWNNKYGGDDVNFSIHNNCHVHIQSGRDYFDNVQKPGYTPYTYPHPLITNGTSPEPIINVYPNPCRVYQGDNSITFFGDLSIGDNIKVYDMSGKTIHDSGELSEATYQWNVSEIASGIFFFVVKSADGLKKTSGKLAIIR